MDLLLAVVSGAIPSPPMAHTMGFFLVEVAEGQATFQCTIDRRLLNPFGTVHGGVALALLDSAAGCAVHTLLPAGAGYTSIETKANYTQPLTVESGTVRAEGRVLSKGKRIATAEAKMFAEDGTLVAHGSSTLMILDKVPWRH
jgi:uncharacterized protein (TIGR00369 family)